MLKHGEANPIAVHGQRRLEHIPPHFTLVPFDLKTSTRNVTNWIHTNLEGRFWHGEYFYHNDDGKAAMRNAVAFEIAEEATYFLMFLDEINRADF